MQIEDVTEQQQPESDLFGKSFHSNWKSILVKTERQGICYLCEELSDAWQ